MTSQQSGKTTCSSYGVKTLNFYFNLPSVSLEKLTENMLSVSAGRRGIDRGRKHLTQW